MAYSPISILPQRLNDYKKLRALGVKRLHYTGNLKYIVPPLPVHEHKLHILQNSLETRKVVLFVSTHPQEEEIIINIYKELKTKLDSLIFIIAPRHPNRSSQITSLLKHNRYHVAVRSKKQPITTTTEFYVADTIGELGTLMTVAHISVICGSFVNIGGHNPIEAAKLKSAIIMGPYTSKQKEICSEFKKSKAAIFVKNYKECATAIHSLFSNQDTKKKYITNALALMKTKNDILRDTILKIKPYL